MARNILCVRQLLNDEVYQYSYEMEIMKAYFQGNLPKCPINDGLRNMAIKVKGTIPTK